MSTKSSGRLKIPQWAVVSRVVTAWNIVRNEYDVEQSRSRADITLGVVHFTVKDADGNIVIQKTSTDVAEIEILNQLIAATKGQARVYFVEADTAPLTVGAEYWFDCWVVVDGVEEPIVDRGRFIVCESVTHVAAGPAPNLPTFPASQTPQERSFLHTWSVTGDSDAVAIPGTGMVDVGYNTHCSIEDLPSGGSPVAILRAPLASHTTTTFVIEASGDLDAGTTVVCTLRDRA